MVASLHLELLGGLQITRDGAPVTGFISAKVQALLCFLAVERLLHMRAALAARFWGELPEADAASNLRQALANLRRILAAHLVITRYTVALTSEGAVWIDCAAFETQIAAALAGPDIEQLRIAVDLYRGDFLDGFNLRGAPAFDEWATLQRERLHTQALTALHTLGDHAAAHGEYAVSAAYALRVLALDPWREEAHRQLMWLYVRSGQRSAALAQYQTCRRVLTEELGVEPMAETTRLYERIKGAQTTGLYALPAPPTPFVGRVAEQAVLARYLASADCRLITITGPGGIGKTRLALQMAAEWAPRFLHGVCLVHLTTTRSSEVLLSTIATALGCALRGSEDGCGQLLAWLHDKHLLLVLDNLEQVIAGGAALIAEVLRAAPEVTLLVTSRERLQLQHEWLVELEGLDVPAVGVAQSEAYSAVQLFLQTAHKVRADFAPTRADIQRVAQLCRLVEGLPLGIELAAVWVRVLSCADIVTEIAHSLEFLNTSLRDIAPRHRSLRAVFDHSWRLLNDAERRTLSQLTVFRGSFPRDAAVAVAGASLAILAALVDKSLVRSQQSGRYELHGVVRQYAGEYLLAAGASVQTQQRHADWYLALAEAAEPHLKGAAQALWLERLEAEQHNLRAALGWAIERQAWESAVRFGAALWTFWWIHGHVHDGRTWAQQILPQRGELPLALAAQALHVAGALASTLGAEAEALPLFEASLEAYRAVGNRPPQAVILVNMGMIVSEQGDYCRARALAEAGLALSQELGNRHGVALALGCLGNSAFYQGDYPGAQTYYSASLVAVRERGSTHDIAVNLHNLGDALRYQGDYAQASRVHLESLALFRTLEAPYGIGHVLHSLAESMRHRDDEVVARGLYLESLTLAQQLNERHQIGRNLAGLAALMVAQGQVVRAVRLLAVAEGLLAASPTPVARADQADYAQTVAVARAQMNEQEFAAVWAEGQALTVEQAIQLVVDNARAGL